MTITTSKGNREPCRRPGGPQIPLTRTPPKPINIACKEKAGYEADDIIATLAVQARARWRLQRISSSDKDLDAVGSAARRNAGCDENKKASTVDGVFEKFGVVPPTVWSDVQALAGDIPSSNVPGATRNRDQEPPALLD